MIIVLFYKFYEKTLEQIMFLSQVLVGMQDTKLLIIIEQQQKIMKNIKKIKYIKAQSTKYIINDLVLYIYTHTLVLHKYAYIS